MIQVGDILSTMGDVQYCGDIIFCYLSTMGGYYDTSGGYHEYCGGVQYPGGTQIQYTCLSILLATFNYRARGTCGPNTFNYSLNEAANA